MKRQKIRKTIILVMFLLFPIIIWYFSPYLIIQGALEHIINGSFIVFFLMLILSMFLGRVWCGYFCPMGCVQEICGSINSKPTKQGKFNSIKYVIWGIWIILVITSFILGKGDITIDPLYMTEYGISVSDIYGYIIYYGVMILFVIPSLIHGKRASCHYICWMAPFMVIGSSVGRFLHFPQLHIESKSDKCVSCKACNKACPMGLDVQQMVSSGTNHKCSECILCGACVDACSKRCLNYKLVWR